MKDSYVLQSQKGLRVCLLYDTSSHRGIPADRCLRFPEWIRLRVTTKRFSTVMVKGQWDPGFHSRGELEWAEADSGVWEG
jgi:hypothetical protein